MALYNSYRPLTFDDMAGNKSTIQTLTNHFNFSDHNRAILLTGETGCGKTTAARILARQLLNKEPADNIKETLNYYELNIGADRGIDIVREINQRLNFKPFGISPVIYFFDECASMTSEAQNALLKSMEDVQDFTYLLFASSEPSKLLPSFRSRCSSFNFEPLSEYEIIGLMDNIVREERKNINSDNMEKIAMLSGCRPREAFLLLEKVISLPDDKRTEALLEIAEKLGVSQSTVSNCKRQAVKKGYLTEDGTLTPDGEDFLLDVQFEHGKEAIELPFHLT